MSRSFDFYEYAGYIMPGAVLLLGLLYFFPEARALFGKEGVTFGELGIFVIVSYTGGQLIQAIGNGIEWLWWRWQGGMPSGRILAGELVKETQHGRSLSKLGTAVKVSFADPNALSAPDRRAIVQQVYALVLLSGKAARVDTFNGNYGLMRGLSASFLVLTVVALVLAKYYVAVLLAFLFALALLRMHRFSRHYADELFAQFLIAQPTTSK